MLYAGCNILLCCLAATIGGFPSIWALVATSFFMSIMFPTIFALGLEELGHETEFASSFIVMAICGAAVVPPLMALFAVSHRRAALEHVHPGGLLCRGGELRL